jgi:hypothetical protein
LKLKLITNGFVDHGELFRRTVAERIDIQYAPEGMAVEFAVDADLGASESYRICEIAGGWKIIGSDTLGLYFGMGKFLHTARWEKDVFVPNPPEVIKTPDCSFRAMYFPLHHYQWYHLAPVEKLEAYVDDMLLWGYNAIVVIGPGINTDSFEDKAFLEASEKIRRINRRAKMRGMRVGTIICPNQGIKSAPEEFNATPGANLLLRGNSGRNLCPSKPGAVDYLKTCWQKAFEDYQEFGLDYIITWPYDEGGCGCEKCRPWGANGYLNVCAVLKDEARKVFPDVEMIVSTWVFDDPEDEGEFEGLYKRLTGDTAWADYLMVDAHREFPRYPLEHSVIKPIVNFPEISMWGLNPWGGYGANPLPKRFQSIWDSSKHILQGGLPYSEGVYEDILKIQWSGYYWDKDRNYRDIIAEYVNYEYFGEIDDAALELMEGIEYNHDRVAKRQEPDLDRAVRVETLARQINGSVSDKVKNCWRWRVLYIRAVLDLKRYRYFYENNLQGIEGMIQLRYYSGDFLKEDAEAQEMLLELRTLYHMDPANKNKSTLPPVGGSNYVIAGIEKYLLEGIY